MMGRGGRKGDENMIIRKKEGRGREKKMTDQSGEGEIIYKGEGIGGNSWYNDGNTYWKE